MPHSNGSGGMLLDHGLEETRPCTSFEPDICTRVAWNKITAADVGKKRESSVFQALQPYKTHCSGFESGKFSSNTFVNTILNLGKH